tara:strand:+ start:846 stop:1022 length:177 start_codon:yes stop_codon:yes gene_type:complete
VRQPSIEQADQDLSLHVPENLQLMLHLGQLQERFPFAGFCLVPLIVQAEDGSGCISVH